MEFLKSLWTDKAKRNGLVIALIALGVIALLVLTY